MTGKNKAIALLGKKLTGSVLLALIAFSPAIAPPVAAQLKIEELLGGSKDQNVTGMLRLDGNGIIELAAPSTALTKRIERIEQNLAIILSEYLRQETMDVQVTAVKQTETNLPEIYVNGHYLLTITEADAKSQGNTPWDLVRILKEKLPEVLKKVKTERKSESFVTQSAISAGILLATGMLSLLLSRLQKGSGFENLCKKILLCTSHQNLSEEQKENIKKTQKILLPAVQGYLWMGSLLIILNIIPYTRPFQGVLLSVLRTPLFIGAIIVVIFVINQLINVLIERFIRGLVGTDPLERVLGEPRREEQRIVSISVVGKSLARFILILIGIFLSLTTAGFNFVSLIAVAGIFGLIATFIAQSFLKDAVNGLLILIEDQFALDDVIMVENLELGGIVENLTLRMTQLRDVDGRLITIPNSQIEAVSNHTHHWGRVDLKIPVPYNVDINYALEIVKKVAREIKEDEVWKDIILDDPNLLGVDEFADWRALIRLWIKCKPIKQWDLGRECRRRILLAFKEAGLELPVFMHDIRLKTSLPFESDIEKEPQKPDRNGKQLVPERDLGKDRTNYAPEPASEDGEAGEGGESGRAANRD